MFCLCVSWTDKAPLSKGLLLVLNGLTVMLTLLPQYQELFVYNLQAVTQQHQVWLHSLFVRVAQTKTNTQHQQILCVFWYTSLLLLFWTQGDTLIAN